MARATYRPLIAHLPAQCPPGRSYGGRVMLRLLGTVSAGDGSKEPVPISTPRLRLLLAILGANHRTPVPTTRLIDLVWGDDPPTTAAGAIQVGISKLRTVFEPDRARRTPSRYLHTDGPNYVLELPNDRFDVTHFCELAERGRSMRGNDLAALAALDLWSDPPFAEFCDASWAIEPIRRLRELRGAVARDRLARAVRDRAETPLLGDLAEERRRAPDDERLAGLEMVALYRSGRQDEAVAVYQSLRKRLRDDRGLDPTPELQGLERAILQHDVDALHQPARTEPILRRTGAFFGREKDLARLSELADRANFVTVFGVGGVGKTTLVRELVANRTADTLTWIDFAERPQNDGVARAIGDGLGLEEQPLRAPLEAVADLLQLRSALLVLDNCEAVIGGIREVVPALLSRCPELRIVITSRVPTDLLAESCLAIGPLETPPTGATTAAIDQNPCVQLLRHWCGQSGNNLDGPAVVELCRRLDGLPLALQLAGFHLRSLNASDYLNQMAVLDGPEDLPERHRTIDAVIDESVASLEPFAVAVLDAVAICRGRVTASFLVPLLDDREAQDQIPVTLANLSRRGLLTAHTAAETYAYSALETVRAHRRRALEEGGRLSPLAERHARTVLRLVGAAKSPAEAAKIDRLGPELHEALDRLEITADNPTLHLRLVTEAGTLWYRSGQVHNALDRMRTAFGLHGDSMPAQRGTVAATIALMSFSVGAYRDMVEWASQAVSLFEEVGLTTFPTLETARAIAERRLDDAKHHASAAVASLEPATRQGVIARDMAANVAWFRGDHNEAASLFRELERAGHAAGEPYFIGRGLRGRAVMMAWTGAPEGAISLCRQSEAFVNEAQPDRGITQQIIARAAISLELSDTEAARGHAIEVLTRCVRQFDAQPVTIAVPILCHVEQLLGHPLRVARLSGWFRGLRDSTGIYPPHRSGSLLDTAESAAFGALGARAWSEERAAGAGESLSTLLGNGGCQAENPRPGKTP